jgi:predicted dehydrogenase
MAPLRIGLLGCGGIAHSHTGDYYSKTPAEVELVACADPDEPARTRFGELYGVPDLYADAAELLARSDIDAVDICAPPAFHPRLIQMAAAAGKHAISEKPLALDYAEAAQAVEVARQNGVKVGVMQNYRWRPEYIQAHNTLASGGLGKPFMASVQAMFHWNGGVAYRLAAEKMMMVEVTYHYVDLLRFLLDSDVTRVYAVAGRPASEVAVGETYAAMMLHFASGAVGNIVNSGECMGITANWGGETVVQAERGTVYINYKQPNTFAMYSGGFGGRYEHQFPAELYNMWTHVTYDKPLSAYYRAFAAGREPPVSGADNLNTLAAVLAAYESAETGQAVDVAAFVDRQSAGSKQSVLA